MKVYSRDDEGRPVAFEVQTNDILWARAAVQQETGNLALAVVPSSSKEPE